MHSSGRGGATSDEFLAMPQNTDGHGTSRPTQGIVAEGVARAHTSLYITDDTFGLRDGHGGQLPKATRAHLTDRELSGSCDNASCSA